jgi:polygalacturonase
MARFILLWTGYLLIQATGWAQTTRDGQNPQVYNIINYGAVPDGRTSNTAAIQQTVNECHRNGGGKIIIPAGNFVTGTIRLFSNMNLCLEAGSVLSGSDNDKEYLYQKDFGFSGPGAGIKTGILVAHNEQNISVTGSGTINGHGTSSMFMDSIQHAGDFNAAYTRQNRDYMDLKYGHQDGPVLWKGSYEERPGVMVIFSGCKNVQLSNIKFEESPNWTVAFLNSIDIKVTGIIIENNMSIPNSDGIDMYDSKNIIISGCVIQSGDDAIAVISSSYVTVSNCILHSRSCGIRVGYNVFNNNNSGNLLFNNINIYDSNRGIGIFQRRQGNMENMIFSNIIISTRLHTGPWWGHGEPIHISVVPGLGSEKTGIISNIRFSNITASSESGIVIFGTVKGFIEDIYFDNINLTIKKSPLEEGYGGNLDLRPVNNIALGIFSHTIPALYSTFADGLVIRNMIVCWETGLPSYFNHAVECTDFGTVTIDGVHERLPKDGHAGSASTVYLHKGGTAHIKNITSTDKMKKLILNDGSD